MSEIRGFEVVERSTGWVLRRDGRVAMVEFPTRGQAIRAGLAVCVDEGLAGLRVRSADGVVEELDPTRLVLDV